MVMKKKGIKKTLQQRRKEAKIRRAVFLFLVVLCLCGLIFIVWAIIKGMKPEKQDTDKTNLHNSSVVVSETSSADDLESAIFPVSSSSSQEGSSSKPITSSSAASSRHAASSSKSSAVNSQSTSQPSGDWQLILVNKSHSLSSSFSVKTSSVGTLEIDSRILKDYNAMIAAAKADGIPLKIISGYRTNAFQTSNFNRQVNKYINQGYSSEDAKTEAAKYVAPPGMSEHQTGLAVDLISPDWYSYNSSLTGKFDQTKQFKWLYANCAKYGFILRYPSDKEDITLYSYEPWHYRYVGVEHATKIMAQGLCLEEYVDGN